MESNSQVIKPSSRDNEYVMLDGENQIILSGIKKIQDLGQLHNKNRWRIIFSDERETIISEDGLFYSKDLFPYTEYEFVQFLTLDISECYIVKKNGKYGIILFDYIGRMSYLYNIEYENIEVLRLNEYLYGKAYHNNYIRITQNGKSYIHILSAGKKSKIYDQIITPPQPLSQWIVELDHKYGLINRLGDEIIEPVYDSMFELCSKNGLSLRLQTENLYKDRETLKIKRIVDYQKHISTFIDESGMIKGDFCYHEKFEDYEGVVEYEILKFPPNKKERVARCNRVGFYYDVFDAKVFDFVECLSENHSLYLCEINGRFGVLDKNLNPILDLVYKDIQLINREELLLLVSTEFGMFIYDLIQKAKSKTYEYIFSNKDSYYIFKSNNKYGIIDKNGNILIPNNYDQSSADRSNLNMFRFRVRASGHPFVVANYAGQQYPIFIKDDKYFGYVERKYDECINIMDSYFLIKKNNKYGLIDGYKKILDPIYDDIIFFNDYPNYQLLNLNLKDVKGSICITFIILRNNNSYQLFNLCKKEFVLSDCDEILFSAPPSHDHYNKFTNNWGPAIIAKKNGKYGLLDKWGNQKLDFEWDNIKPACKGFIITYNNKKGYYTFANEWITDCVYDEFITTPWSIKGLIHGEETEVKAGNIQEVDEYYKNRSIRDDYPTYNRYSGSYAQDEMGYSDDEIDTIFDGDPDAYWNID